MLFEEYVGEYGVGGGGIPAGVCGLCVLYGGDGAGYGGVGYDGAAGSGCYRHTDDAGH